MNFILLTFAALSAHFSCVQAYQFSTTKSCTTQYGEKSVSIKTSSYTTTTPITVLNKYTTTPTIIITPSLQTTTSTTTTTVGTRPIEFNSLRSATLMILGHRNCCHNLNRHFHRHCVYNVHCESCAILISVTRSCHYDSYFLIPTSLQRSQL